MRDQMISEFLDAVEVDWVSDGLPERLAVLDVTGVVADTGVKDVVQRIASEEEVADDAQTPPIHLVSPQPTQILHSVDHLLLLTHHLNETAKGHLLTSQQAPHLPLVLLDETDDALAEVLRNVLSLILHFLGGGLPQVLHWKDLRWEAHLEDGVDLRFERLSEIAAYGRVQGISKLDFFEGEEREGVEGECEWGVRRGLEWLELVVGVFWFWQLEFEVVDHGEGWFFGKNQQV